MNHHDELAKRISLVRRDLGNLLFHFTRKPEHDIEVIHNTGSNMSANVDTLYLKRYSRIYWCALLYSEQSN